MLFHRFSHRFLRRLAVWLVAAVLAGGCSYKIEIEQGDEFLTAQMSALELGMTRQEVVSILGRPNLPRLFRPDIWLYGYQIRQAGFDGESKLVVLELHFDEDGQIVDMQVRGDEVVEE